MRRTRWFLGSLLMISSLLLSLSCDGGGPDGEAVPPDTTTFLALGLEDKAIFGLSFAAPYLYAATKHDGLWRTDVQEGLPTTERVWEFVGTPVPEDAPLRMLFDVLANPDDPEQLMVTAAFNGGLFRSLDGGRTWLPKPDHVTRFMAFFQECSDRILLGARYETRDFGETWVLLNEENRSDVSVIACHPADPNLIWVGGSNAFEYPILGYSHDGGRTWTMLDFSEIAQASGVSGIGLDPDDPRAAYVATRGTIYLTRDLGRTWTALTVSERAVGFQAMLFIADRSDYLLAGGNPFTGGPEDAERVNLVETRDDGATWQALRSPLLEEKTIGVIVWGAETQAAYLGTNRGVVRYKPRRSEE